jgi:2-polyprenyl-6-methoxyphenol hydroxylase-like FAD-dependent oxidoreductase
MISKEPNNNNDLPIVIAGGGCVGLFLALLLTHSSLPNQIIVIEPQHPDPASTRAMAHQPPTFPLFAQIPGLLPELIKAGSLSEGLCFRTSVKNGSRVIASKKFDNSGEGMKGKGQLLLPQGKFQQVLIGRLTKSEQAEVRLGWSVDGFEQVDDNVSVRIRAAPICPPTLPYDSPNSTTASESAGTTDTETHTETINASYLIGADGAHSLVRKAMGLELEGETLDAQLVATDLRFPFKAHGFFDANFIVDAQDYGLIGRIDNAGLWRVSYGVPGSQSEEEIRENVHEKLEGMLPNGGRDGEGSEVFEVVRVAPYRAQQRCAETLVRGRVLLVGDAAHCKSPSITYSPVAMQT